MENAQAHPELKDAAGHLPILHSPQGLQGKVREGWGGSKTLLGLSEVHR